MQHGRLIIVCSFQDDFTILVIGHLEAKTVDREFFSILRQLRI